MSVEIDPSELGFRRPFTVEVSEVLKIRNPNTHPVAFKVKTTAPKQYCVRPNSGRVEPGKEVEVSVILQAMKQEPPMDTKCRDKFLVQSVAITSDQEFANLTSIWEGIDKSSVQEKKIRVVFLSAGGTSEGTPDIAPPAYSSPGNYGSATRAEPKSSTDEPEFKTEDSPSVAQGFASSSSAATSSVASPEKLKAELAQAEKIIAQLKAEQGGLRQRKTGGATAEDNSQPAQLAQAVRTGTEGVPVQVTAALCFLSFLLAYLFF
ncbi:putative integral ER membrane protein Scs2 [Pseudomassariella vexata]|uniref:Putative integral ER membrane protein Scs2 n=1 Tax=Pseudomassariella vexata TaxID=1141098 RepID=A0A1Y2E1W9_9PEZI|nr:putative integral ER membrane protein Scs2 [Pseudomassariella vexata]ORY65522.1 putative integral ER membrane protein Scs2 [Pseudomassariella vexata]